VSEQDQAIIERVRVLKEEAKKQKELLAELEQRVEDAANAILAQRNELARSKNQLVASQNELAGVRNDRRAVLGQVRDSRIRLEGDLRELEAEQARVTAQLQGAPAPVQHGSGQLIWPVSGPVVSGFGMRWGRLHAGLDIAVPAGTGIRAADGGQVVLAAWTGGYGNYVCIQHNGSLSTCYAHLSSYGVSSGASVSQGQVIGSVGCTGHCFGDHLHFETRVNGSPVDPMGYL
jgi:murein DD-endopeptidase MepM/ murein hydrolase activator NlpD